LVEDDKSLREIYGVRLLAEGYDIVSAGDGEEALAMAIKERPQLILSDVMMPKISGFDMLDILRSTTETRDIKVIMMTALSSEDQRARGEALGADRYLVKSQVGIEDVVRTVHEVLGDAPVTTTTPAFAAPPAPSAVPRPAPTSYAPQRPAPAPTYDTSGPQQQQATPMPQQPQMQPIQQPQPLQQPPQQMQQPAPAPASAMPQPTAPFSTTRPANLGDRIIHPIQRPQTEGPDLASLMNDELNQSQQSDTPAFAATPPPAPQPPVTPQPVMPPVQQQPAVNQPQPTATAPGPMQQPQPQPQQMQQPAPQQQSAPTPPPPPAQPLTLAEQLTQAVAEEPSVATPAASPFGPTPQSTDQPMHGATDIAFEETPRQPVSQQSDQPPAH
ncbi:MAG: response regulator, partial [Candidatus Saccharimonadales bacterium]